MEKLTLLNHILIKAKSKGACNTVYTLYEKAIKSKDYETASQIALGYRYWLKNNEIIHITCEELQDILAVNTGLRYHENGQIEVKETLKKGQSHGEFVSYYKSGKILEKTTFKENLRHGKCVIYYEWGQIWVEKTYKDGQLHGELIEYYKNGRVKGKEIYENGKLIQSII